MKILKEKFYYFTESIVKLFSVKRKTQYPTAAKPVLAKGFTLTEVLVVVLVIGVISAIAYPVYTKAINKSRAVEAINLLEMVRNKQIANHARNGEYHKDFTDIGQLTNNKETSNGNKMTVGKYELTLNAEASCITAAYVPSEGRTPIFTFSSGYEESGLGCEGDICTSFGNIVGGKASVCNCGGKTCGPGFDMDPVSCSCSCGKECNQNGACFDKSQNQVLTQPCGNNNSGTQSRTCTASCNGGDCSGWGQCTGQSCGGSQPASSRACGNCGTETGTVSCNGNTGQWQISWSGVCGGQGICAPGETKACGNGGTQKCTSGCGWGSCENEGECANGETKSCGNCGTQTCTNYKWGACNNQGVCSPGERNSCGNGGTKLCNSSCGWGSCEGENKTCDEYYKPGARENCGTCGVRTRSISCDTKTGTWVTGSWGSCQEVTKPADTTSACGECGKKTTTYTCQQTGEVPYWTASAGACVEAAKPSISSRNCGNCNRGTEKQILSCSSGTWVASWSGVCANEPCKPGTQTWRTCRNGQQVLSTCNSSCSSPNNCGCNDCLGEGKPPCAMC